MLHGQEIHFVCIVDYQSKMHAEFSTRIWHHEKMVKRLLANENCLIGKTTFDLTHWKGPKSWVLTSDVKWKRIGVGTIHNLDDLHLHSEGPIYVLGGKSLFHQLEDVVDSIHLYIVNDDTGTEDFIDLDMSEWKPEQYENRGIWSYANLIKSPKSAQYKQTINDYFDLDDNL